MEAAIYRFRVVLVFEIEIVYIRCEDIEQFFMFGHVRCQDELDHSLQLMGSLTVKNQNAGKLKAGGLGDSPFESL